MMLASRVHSDYLVSVIEDRYRFPPLKTNTAAQSCRHPTGQRNDLPLLVELFSHTLPVNSLATYEQRAEVNRLLDDL
jgi:hypothetical protein